jgi:hypothetical protein
MNIQTTIRLFEETPSFISVSVNASQIGAKDEYTQYLHYHFQTGDIIGGDETYYRTHDSGYREESGEVPAEIAAALEAEIPRGIEVIVGLLAKRNLQPIKPLTLD